MKRKRKQQAHPGAFKTYLRFISSVYRRNKLFFFAKVFISILSGVLTVVTAIIPKYMADAILIDHSEYGFLVYVLLYVLSQFVIAAIINWIELYIDKALVMVNARCTDDILDQLHRMIYANYEQPESRNCIERAFRFATQTGVTSFNTFLSLIGTMITFTSYVYIIAKHNWITLVLLTISITATYILQKKKAMYEYQMKRSMTTDERRINYYKSALLDKKLAKDIRYSGAFALIRQCFDRQSRDYSDKMFRKSRKLYLYNQSMTIIQLALVFAVMASFGQRMFHGNMTYGDYTVSVNVSMMFTNLVFQIIGQITSIYTTVLDGTNYADFLKLSASDGNEPCPAVPDIVFDHVSFQYGTEDRLALKDFSFTFRAGKKYALVGENGSGKSTVLKLLLGMYTPNEGRITIGGVDIRSMDPEALYSLYAVVFQDFRLLEGVSLQDNVTAGKKTVPRPEIDRMIDSIGLHARMQTEDGEDTLSREYARTFDKNGVELSGGEQQKFVIARALLKNAPVLILDEPTSAFDEASQNRLFDTVLKTWGKTLIFVTHDAPLTRCADEILTMKNGELLKTESNPALIE